MKYLKKKLIQYLVRNLLAALTTDDILIMSNNGWALRGRKLSPEEIAQFKEEARSFKGSLLWQIITNEVKYLANLRMFEKGIDSENTVFGRAMLYNIEIMQSFLDRTTKL